MKKVNREGRMSSLNISKRGITMKKTLIFVMAAVCIFATLLVSCSNEAKLSDETVSIRFGFDQSRGLNASQNIPNVDELYWYYKAKRTVGSDSDEINLGEKTSWTRVNSNSTGLDGIITLAQGRWDFELQGRKTTDSSTAVYQGSISNVLILRDGNNVNTIIVPVSQLTDGVGSVVLSKDIKVKKSSYSNSSYSPTHYKYKATTAETYGDDTLLSKEEGALVDTTISLAAGTYDFVVMYKGTDKDAETQVETEIIYASSPITVTVSANIETKISGSLEVVTASGQFGVEVVGSKATASVVPSETEAVSVVVPITPSEEQGADTTVTFEEGAIPSDATKVVTEVKTIEEARSANFNVSVGATAIAAIDLKITDDSGIVKTVTDGKTVTVKTYILKGLSQNSLNLVYTGDLVEGMSHRVTEYEPETGKLVFQTNHFSEFFVETDAVCYSEKNNRGYSSLVDAAAESSSTDTIHILCDIDLSSFVDEDGDGYVIEELYGTLDGSKGDRECYNILMPESEDIYYLIGNHASLTVSNINIVLGARDSILPLISPKTPSYARVTIDNVDYSSSEDDHSYAIGHNSSVYGSYFVYSGNVTFKNCDVSINLDGTRSNGNFNSAVFYGGYHFGSTKVSVENCSYTGEYIGPYVALVISNGQGITSTNTKVSGLVNNGRLFGLKDAHAVGAQNTKNITIDVSGNGTISKAVDSAIEINKNNNVVTFTASTNEKAESYILQLAGVRKIFNASGVEFAQNYNYDIRFTNVTPNSSIPLYRMIDIDTAKENYGFKDEDFTNSQWVSTGSYYEGDGEYCIAEKSGVKYYVLQFNSSEDGYKYVIDTMPSQVNVMVLDESGKLIEIKSN